MNEPLHQLGRKPQVASGPAWLAAGFRPFFLLAALVGTWSVLSWLGWLRGMVALPGVSVDLHVHEMVFGFTMAVVAGFLLTAVRNWTGLDPAPPRTLAVLVGLYALGRIGVVLDATGMVRGAAAVDLLFLFALAVAVAVPIGRAKSRRNVGIVVVLAVLAIIDGSMHFAAVHGSVPLATAARAAALLAPCVLVAVIGGRVIPLFTKNAVSNGDDGPRVREPGLIDKLALVAMALVVPAAALAALLPALRVLDQIVDVVAGVLCLARMYGWASAAVLRRPILWVLHLGYAALGVGLVLRGLPMFASASAAAHVLGVGALALTSLGMMTRVSLGHTGRALVLPRAAVAAYVALVGAAVARVAAVHWPVLLDVAGTLFAASFTLFIVAYAPILLAPRADGKPG